MKLRPLKLYFKDFRDDSLLYSYNDNAEKLYHEGNPTAIG